MDFGRCEPRVDLIMFSLLLMWFLALDPAISPGGTTNALSFAHCGNIRHSFGSWSTIERIGQQWTIVKRRELTVAR
jgi:hypothetical protein